MAMAMTAELVPDRDVNGRFEAGRVKTSGVVGLITRNPLSCGLAVVKSHFLS